MVYHPNYIQQGQKRTMWVPRFDRSHSITHLPCFDTIVKVKKNSVKLKLMLI